MEGSSSDTQPPAGANVSKAVLLQEVEALQMELENLRNEVLSIVEDNPENLNAAHKDISAETENLSSEERLNSLKERMRANLGIERKMAADMLHELKVMHARILSVKIDDFSLIKLVFKTMEAAYEEEYKKMHATLLDHPAITRLEYQRSRMLSFKSNLDKLREGVELKLNKASQAAQNLLSQAKSLEEHIKAALNSKN